MGFVAEGIMEKKRYDIMRMLERLGYVRQNDRHGSPCTQIFKCRYTDSWNPATSGKNAARRAYVIVDFDSNMVTAWMEKRLEDGNYEQYGGTKTAPITDEAVAGGDYGFIGWLDGIVGDWE